MDATRKATPDTTEGDTLVVPVVAETLELGIHTVSKGGVRVQQSIHERVERVDPPLTKTEVEIERRVINQLLDGPPPQPHRDGDTLVVPVLEEVAVVQKRWLLKEELRLRQTSQQVHAPQDVRLRRAHVTVERFADEPDGGAAIPPTHPKEEQQ